MRYLKKNEMFIDNFPTYNFRGFVYTPNTHGGKVYHTVVKDCRFVIDLSGPSNAVFSRKEFIDNVNKVLLQKRWQH